MRRRTLVGASAALVVLLAGLGAVEAARSGPDPVSLTGSGERYRATVRLDRAATGVIEVEIDLDRDDGVEAVSVCGVMAAMGHVTPELPARRVGRDRFRARGELFSMPGAWQLDIRVETADGVEAIAIDVQVETGGE